MKRKPVSVALVTVCLVLVLGMLATLFLPIFSMKLDIGAVGSDYVNITGLDIIKSFFAQDYLAQPESVKTLLSFLGQGPIDISQYVNPIFINTAIITYLVAICITVIMLIGTIFNFAGIRMSIINVFAGLITFICGIITTICVYLQNGEFIENILVKYDFKIAIGSIILIVAGFLYIMFAPKKRY